MKTIFFLTLHLVVLTSVCQVPSSELNPQGKKFFQTLSAVAKYLKIHKTIPLTFHASEAYSNEEAFYDTVLSTFFSKEKMLKILEKDTLELAIAGKLDWARHILNEFDYYLDVIPSDSIFIQSLKSDDLPNTLEVYLNVNKKNIPLFLFYFDSTNDLLVSLSIGGIPDYMEFVLYLKRQKKYYEFPDPFRKN